MITQRESQENIPWPKNWKYRLKSPKTAKGKMTKGVPIINGSFGRAV
jgi:hypothetical protein